MGARKASLEDLMRESDAVAICAPLNASSRGLITAELLDLIDGGRYHWADEWNYVELNPHVLPGHLLRLQSLERPAGGQAEKSQ